MEFSLCLLVVFERESSVPAMRIFLMLAVNRCGIVDVSSVRYHSRQLVHSLRVW